MLSRFIYFYLCALRFSASPPLLQRRRLLQRRPVKAAGELLCDAQKTLTNFPSAFRWFWLSAANALRSVFPKRAEVERSVSPVAELNAEMREGRLVRDITSHRGGPAADLISSSWLQRREHADLITARLSPSCGALSCVHGFLGFFPNQFQRRLLSSSVRKERAHVRSPHVGAYQGSAPWPCALPPKGELMRR